MTKKKIIALVVILAVVVIAAVVLAIVFHNDGPYKGTVVDADGSPMANVSVTDGRHVVKTDADGKFKLRGWHETHFITVTAPAGYLAQTHYIRADKATESYDFTLTKSEIPAGAAHSFLQVSDTEIGAGGTGEWLEHVKKVGEEMNTAFLVHTGDICYEDGLKRHIQDMNAETMGFPVFYCMGNHDYVDGKYGEELFESIYGPTWFSFEVGNVHYIVTPFGPWGDKASCYTKKDCWRWLKNDLDNTDDDMNIVIFNHTTPWTDDYVLKFDGKKLDLKEHNLLAWAFGHYHYNYVEDNNGVMNISTGRPDCGGIDSSVSGTRQIMVSEDGKITTKMHYYEFVEENAAAPQNAVWTTKLGENVLFCDTVYKDGKIFTATVHDDVPVAGGVYCLNAADGSVQWKFTTENVVKNNVVLSGENVYAQDAEGNVYCLKASDGSLVWKVKVNLGNSVGTSIAPCVADGKIFVGCAAGVTALDLNTGAVVWENIRNHGEGSPAEFIVTGDKLIVSSNWDALMALDMATGKQLWENKDEDIRFRISTPVVIDDSTLLVADSGAIAIVDSNTGEITSKTKVEGCNFSSSAQPVINGNKAYIATATTGILAFDLTTHEVLWKTPVGTGFVGTSEYVGKSQTVESTFVLQNGELFFGASDGNFYRVSTSDGTVLQTVAVGAPIFGKAAYVDGEWVVGDFAGRVTRLHF